MPKPYAFINDQVQNFPQIKSKLNLDKGAHSKFDVLNTHIRNSVVMPGELVIVGDDRHPSCTLDEAMQKARDVHLALAANAAGSDGFIVHNYDLFQSLLGNASLGIGSATGAWSKHLDGVKNTLEEINALHKQHLSKGGPARNDFISKRQIA